jgi:hypothetical protein
MKKRREKSSTADGTIIGKMTIDLTTNVETGNVETSNNEMANVKTSNDNKRSKEKVAATEVCDLLVLKFLQKNKKFSEISEMFQKIRGIQSQVFIKYIRSLTYSCRIFI